MATLKCINEILTVIRSLPQSWLATHAQNVADEFAGSDLGWDARAHSLRLTQAVLDAVMVDLEVLKNLHVSTATEARQYDPPIQWIAFVGAPLSNAWELAEDIPTEFQDFRLALAAALADEDEPRPDEIDLWERFE